MRFLYYFLLAFLFAQCQTGKLSKNAESLADVEFDYKPNIVWLSVEDIGCHLPMYGDSTISTPNLERLAREGVVFDNAYTTAGVCAPSRSAIISGLYASQMATHNMRTRGIIPPANMVTFPTYLREAGYYTTNNQKEDYNFQRPEGTWDQSDNLAHYKRRSGNQPFFAVFNNIMTHESRIWVMDWHHLLVDEDKVPVPPYFPQDNEIVKQNLARYYTNIKLMDTEIGAFLEELENNGLLDSTIVVFWSDHGGNLPRQKRMMYNSGIKVPLIIRFPDKKLAGTRVNDLVSLMDLGPTMLSLAGIDKPEHMSGRVFIGPKRDTPREYVFAARDRMDAQIDMSRAVTDGRFKYIRNYYPEKPFKQLNQYRLQIPMMQEMDRLYASGEMDSIPGLWYRTTKPVEELFDTQSDPHEVYNLADNDAYNDTLERMRKAFLDWQSNNTDMGLLPEAELWAIQERTGKAPVDFVEAHPDYYQRIFEVANMSLYPQENKEALIAALDDTIPSVRYWAVRAMGRLGDEATGQTSKLVSMSNDPSYAVQANVAWALMKLGEKGESTKIFRKVFANAPYYANVMAANFAGDLGVEAKHLLPDLQKLTASDTEYIGAAAKSAIAKIESAK